MAKPNRGGLGRGLNSLLSGSFESSAPAAPSPTRERIVVDADDVITSYKEPAQRSSASSVFESSAQLPKSKPTSGSAAEAAPKTTPSVAEKLGIMDILEQKLDEVPLESVSPNPDQPRTSFKPEEIQELAESIEKDGVLQPVLVRETEKGSYQIIAGERRWQACKKLGLKTIPVRIKNVDDGRALELALIENIQRADLNPIEEAYGYRRLIERRNLTQSDIAQIVSKGRSTVANALRLLELPEEAQQLLYEEKISAGHARAILSIPTKEGRQTLTKKLLESKLSVREAESLARLLSGKAEKPSKTREPLPNSYKSVAKTLRDTLHTNVRVKSSKGKNKIEIEFKDEQDLERVFSQIMGQAGANP